MHAIAIPHVRAALAKVTVSQCRDAAELALAASDAADIRSIAKGLLKEES
jgi:phosphoenolpyruvate-protein kinase (PTS system EI component)